MNVAAQNGAGDIRPLGSKLVARRESDSPRSGFAGELARDADPVCSGFARPQSGAEYFRIRCRPVQVSYEFLLQSVASWREFSLEMLHLLLA